MKHVYFTKQNLPIGSLFTFNHMFDGHGQVWGYPCLPWAPPRRPCPLPQACALRPPTRKFVNEVYFLAKMKNLNCFTFKWWHRIIQFDLWYSYYMLAQKTLSTCQEPALMYTYALNRLNLLLLLYSDIQYTHHEDVLYQIQNSDLIGKVFFSLKQINCLIGRSKDLP